MPSRCLTEVSREGKSSCPEKHLTAQSGTPMRTRPLPEKRSVRLALETGSLQKDWLQANQQELTAMQSVAELILSQPIGLLLLLAYQSFRADLQD